MDTIETQSDALVTYVKQHLYRENGPHLYVQIANLIRAQIQSGNLQAGVYLPPQRELSLRWEIGDGTVRRALQVLADENLLEATPGSGTVVRNLEAGSSTNRRSSTSDRLNLGVAFADLADGYPFFQPILAGLREDDRETTIQLFEIPNRDEIPSGYEKTWPPFSAHTLDALIMMSPANLDLLAWSKRQKLLTVLMFNDLADGASHCVMPNYASGLTQTVEHLVQTGRNRIAMVTAAPERFSTGRWLTAYRSVLRAFGLRINPDWEITAGYAEREGSEATRALLNLEERPDAIVFASDFMARGGLLAAHAAGVRVPEDLAIVGAGPMIEDSGWITALATIDLGLFEMGRLTRNLIQSALADPDSGPSRRAIDSRYRPGNTA